MTLRRGKPGLHPGRSRPAKRLPNRYADVARQIRGLIEPALAPPRRVKRHRNRPVGARQHVRAAEAHQFGQRLRQRSPSFVFERVHDRAQRAVICADGTRAIHPAGATPAAGASRQRHADRPPGRQRIAAAIADGRGERKNRSPARWTDRPHRRAFEKLPAGGAARREKDGEDGVGDWTECTNAGMHECQIARMHGPAVVHWCISAFLHSCITPSTRRDLDPFGVPP